LKDFIYVVLGIWAAVSCYLWGWKEGFDYKNKIQKSLN